MNNDGQQQQNYNNNINNIFQSDFLPAPVKLFESQKIDFVFITHGHLDHCDPVSLNLIVDKNSDVTIFGPNSISSILSGFEKLKRRFIPISANEIGLTDGLMVNVIPAAHTEIVLDGNGFYECVGYVFKTSHTCVYHSGDTIPHSDIVATLSSLAPFDIVFLPCNERNYYRERDGIVGNMSVREIFQFAVEINARTVCPIHWDMFHTNSTFPEEIELVYRLSNLPFKMKMPTLGDSICI
jgi:L-ascorbate metabolism protein UlaG (beta-lactamase superfamily)